MMRYLIGIGVVAVALIASAPTIAAEPFAGFSDRLKMACPDVVQVQFSEESALEAFGYAPPADVSALKQCLRTAYAEILNNQFPVSAGRVQETQPENAIILADGTIRLQ